MQPALHLIVSVAQGQPGKDGLYRQRSDPDLIEKIYGMAHARGAITILDLQAGKSTIDSELPVILPFLQRPDVHLGLDPEFNMHHNREGRIPGEKIGAMDADEINYVIATLANLVTTYHLPPKVLVVHRFTTNMLQRASSITARSARAGGDQHGRLGTAVAQVRHVQEVRGRRARAVHRIQAVLPQRHAARRRAAVAGRSLALRPRPIYIQYQ